MTEHATQTLSTVSCFQPFEMRNIVAMLLQGGDNMCFLDTLKIAILSLWEGSRLKEKIVLDGYPGGQMSSYVHTEASQDCKP